MTPSLSTASAIHILLAIFALIAGFTIVAARKGGTRHRWLGWVYTVCMGVSLAAILRGGWGHLKPFHGYAAIILLVLVVASCLPKLRKKLPSWRAWHGALMSFSLLGALVAVGGVLGGLLLGVGNGPAYYRMFDAVIVAFTAVGLWVLTTRRVIWGHTIAPRDRSVRHRFIALVCLATLALVVAQLPLATTR